MASQLIVAAYTFALENTFTSTNIALVNHDIINAIQSILLFSWSAYLIFFFGCSENGTAVSLKADYRRVYKYIFPYIFYNKIAPYLTYI